MTLLRVFQFNDLRGKDFICNTLWICALLKIISSKQAGGKVHLSFV